MIVLDWIRPKLSVRVSARPTLIDVDCTKPTLPNVDSLSFENKTLRIKALRIKFCELSLE